MEDLGPKTNADALNKSGLSSTKLHITEQCHCNFLRRLCVGDALPSCAVVEVSSGTAIIYSTSWYGEGQLPPFKVDEPTAVELLSAVLASA
eukprot:2244244-Pleurochrysis_carterae.AAC.1